MIVTPIELVSALLFPDCSAPIAAKMVWARGKVPAKAVYSFPRYALIAAVHVILAIAMYAVTCERGSGNKGRTLADGTRRFDYDPMLVNTWIGFHDGPSCPHCVMSNVSSELAMMGPNDGPICKEHGDRFCVNRPAMYAKSRANGYLFGQFHPLVLVLTFQWLTASYAVFYLYTKSPAIVWPYVAIAWNLLGMLLWWNRAKHWGLPSPNLFILEIIFLATVMVQLFACHVSAVGKLPDHQLLSSHVSEWQESAHRARHAYLAMVENQACYLRFSEYSTTAGLLAMGLMAFLSIQDEKAYQFALFLIIFTNVWGVAIEMVSGGLAKLKKIDSVYGKSTALVDAMAARAYGAMWALMASSWAVYIGFLVEYLYQLEPIFEAYWNDRGPPVFVVVAMVSVIILYSTFGFITTAVQLVGIQGRTALWYERYMLMLDVCSLVVKGLVGLAVFTSLDFLVSGSTD